MIEIERGTLEAKIIEVLLEVYPVTIDDLKDEVKLPKKSLERGIKKLQVRGIIQLEPLSDKVFIRLVRRDFHFIGRKATQRKPLKRSGKKSKGKDYDGFAYG